MLMNWIRQISRRNFAGRAVTFLVDTVPRIFSTVPWGRGMVSILGEVLKSWAHSVPISMSGISEVNKKTRTLMNAYELDPPNISKKLRWPCSYLFSGYRTQNFLDRTLGQRYGIDFRRSSQIMGAQCAQNGKYWNKFNITAKNDHLIVVEGSLEAYR